MANPKNSKPDSQNQTTKLILVGRFSYLNALVPKIANGSTKAKFSTAVLIPKTDTKQIAAINAAVDAAVVIGIAKCKKWGGKKPPANKFLHPLQDGDEKATQDEKKYGAYKGMYYVNAKSDNKPEIVDKNLQPIIDEKEIYSGMYGRASVNFFPFDNVSVGVGCGLNNLQKLKDGENLGGAGAKAEDEFDDDFVFEEEEDDLS